MKRLCKIFFIFVSLFTFPLFVNAEECSREERNNIYALINNIKFTYTRTENNYFTINIYNIPDGLYLVAPTGSELYPSDNNQASIANYLGGNSYTFKLLSVEHNKCIDDMNYTKTVQVKKYNQYSEKEICHNPKYSDFKYCGEWYQGNITDERFETELKKYEKNLEEKNQIVDDNKDNDNNINIDMIIVGAGILLLGITVIILYTIRGKRRRKL